MNFKPHNNLWCRCFCECGLLKAREQTEEVDQTWSGNRRGWRGGWWLKALAVFAEDWGSVLVSTHMAAHSCNSSCKEINTLFWPPQAPGSHVVHIQAGRQNTHTPKIINKSDPNSLQPRGDRLLTKSASKGQPAEHPQHPARVLNYSSVGDGHRVGQSAGLARGRYWVWSSALQNKTKLAGKKKESSKS